MSINISGVTSNYSYQTDYSAASKKADSVSTSSSDVAAVYEKSSDTVDGTYKEKNAALIEQLKADNQARVDSLVNMVQSAITQQGGFIGSTDDVWKFLASGNFTVSAETKAAAQEAISEDGYWGVKQTSDRILEFAKALSGGDASKAEELKNAFIKGFKQATGTWGKELPQISQDTYDAVIEKFDNWINGES